MQPLVSCGLSDQPSLNPVQVAHQALVRAIALTASAS